MDFEALDAVAQRLMKRRKSHLEREIGSIYDHGQRVAKLVIFLRQAILPQDDSMDDILRLAGLFHDIGKGIEPHAAFGGPIMMQAVDGLVPRAQAQRAAQLIEAHCDRHPDEPKHDLWARLLQDADLLDHIGTYNIWMDIQYCASQGAGVEAELEFVEHEAEAYLKKHRALLNFPLSREIYDDRANFYRAFIDRFRREARGEVYRLPDGYPRGK